MISDEEIERALDWLVKSAEKAAVARANRLALEDYKKVVLAQQMIASKAATQSGKEAEAYASDAYVAHIKAAEAAVTEDELYRWRQKTADQKIEAWRTMSSNNRAQGKI
jgi:hypothetical protein